MDAPGLPPPERRIYCNRTLNLRTIRAVGYDMDYTLVHYRVDEWERLAYAHVREALAARGWPVASLAYDPGLFIRGLIVDRVLGNVVKANRFGYVKRAFHGTRMLDWDAQRRAYERTVVDLSEDRWVFLNTLFSHSEACLYAQLVDRLDAAALPEVLGYGDLYDRIKSALDQAHLEGHLKAEIVANPDRYVDLDPELPLALLDQKESGKRLMLITNSEWGYTRSMMSYAFDRFLPDGRTWRDLFELVVVAARKPEFFTGRQPLLEVVDDEGLLRPLIGPPRGGGVYFGGDAGTVERHLGVPGEEVLYVGDHIFSDVHVSKSVRRWRTALVVRELEDELAALSAFRAQEAELDRLMDEKERLEHRHALARLALQRRKAGYGPEVAAGRGNLHGRLQDLRARLDALDERIGPLARASAELGNPHWGPLMRAGADKSHFARQLEQYADVYTSRVSNFLHHTPYGYLRGARGSLPHDEPIQEG